MLVLMVATVRPQLAGRGRGVLVLTSVLDDACVSFQMLWTRLVSFHQSTLRRLRTSPA